MKKDIQEKNTRNIFDLDGLKEILTNEKPSCIDFEYSKGDDYGRIIKLKIQPKNDQNSIIIATVYAADLFSLEQFKSLDYKTVRDGGSDGFDEYGKFKNSGD